MSKKVKEKENFIKSATLMEEKGTSFSLIDITINLLQQKRMYASFYERLARDVKISGFRKGHVPKEIIKQKIYPKTIEKTYQYLVKKIQDQVGAYIEKENGQYLIDIMEVKDVKFTSVDIPMKIIMKVLIIKGNLGKISEISIDKSSLENIEIDQKDIKKAIQRVWNNWLKKESNKKLLDKYPNKISDKWIKEVLAIKGVENLTQLKIYLKKQLITNKLQVAKETVLKNLLRRAINISKLKLPEDYLQIIVTRESNRVDKELKTKKLTLKKYLKTQDKTTKDFEQDVINQTNDQILTELLFRIYCKENNISLDENSEQDKLYLEEAQQYIHPPQKSDDKSVYSEQLLKYVKQIMDTALNIKSQVLIAKEVGLDLMKSLKTNTVSKQ